MNPLSFDLNETHHNKLLHANMSNRTDFLNQYLHHFPIEFRRLFRTRFQWQNKVVYRLNNLLNQ